MRFHEPVAPVTTQGHANGISSSSWNESIAIFALIIPDGDIRLIIGKKNS
jgi:hypothetical protein